MESRIIPKMVSIVGTIMLQIQNQLLIKRLMSTSINTVQYVNWGSTSAINSSFLLLIKLVI